MLKSGEGALLKLKPATLPKGCWVGVGDAVIEGEDVDDVVGLKGESELGSARRMEEFENAVRSFCRERAGERRWVDGIFVCLYVCVFERVLTWSVVVGIDGCAGCCIQLRR